MAKTKCVFNQTEKGFEFDCGGERKGVCPIVPEGRSGGVNGLGFGGQYGQSKGELHCSDFQDVKKKLEEKYGEEVI